MTTRAAATGATRERSITGDRLLAAAMILAGWTLVYLAMFDQGFVLQSLLGIGGGDPVFHELFHDGRHLLAFPCH